MGLNLSLARLGSVLNNVAWGPRGAAVFEGPACGAQSANNWQKDAAGPGTNQLSWKLWTPWQTLTSRRSTGAEDGMVFFRSRRRNFG